METFGERLRKLREKNCIGIETLAEKVDCASITIYKYESGAITPGAAILGRIADCLGTTMDWLWRGI